MRTFTERLLDALPPPGEPVTTASLAERMNTQDRSRVSRTICRLRFHGFVETPERGTYRLTDAGLAFKQSGRRYNSGLCGKKNGPAHCRKRDFYDGIWQALRMSNTAVTVNDLISLIPQEAHGKTPIHNARRYLRRLSGSGYVTLLKMREPGTALKSPGYKRWRLIKNTGPKTPYWSPKHSKLIDPNMPPGDGA